MQIIRGVTVYFPQPPPRIARSGSQCFLPSLTSLTSLPHPLLSSLVLVLVLALVLVLFFFLGLLGLRAHRVCFDFVDLLSWNPAHHEGRHGWQSPCCKLILLGCFVVSLSECVI